MIVFSITPIYRFLNNVNRDNYYNEDIYISIKQISQYLIGSKYITVDDSYTYMSREDNETTLYLNNNKLIKKPGNEILLYNVDDISFDIRDSYVYINVSRNETSYRFMIGYAVEYEMPDEE